MMKIFQKYIAKGFFAPFFGGLAVFTALLLFGNIFGKLYVFNKGHVNVLVFIKYFLYQVPYFVVKIMPIATLLAVIMAISRMVSTGEWKAGMAGGWRPFDMVKPLLLCAGLAGVFQFGLQETLSPSLYLRSEHIFRRDIRGREDWARLVINNASFSVGKEKLITCSAFDGRTNTLNNAFLGEYGNGKLKKSIYAQKVVWNEKAHSWNFIEAVEAFYGKGAVPIVKKHSSIAVYVDVGPENLILENLVTDGVNIKDLLTRLNRLKLVGAPSVTERTLLWTKLFSPFANIVMALIGIAVALTVPAGSRFYSFGLSIATGFLFWAALVFSQEVGNAELLPPWLAGLMPLLIFAILSLWGLKHSRAF